MNRQKISPSKLTEFIETATELCQLVENKNGYSMSPSLHDEELAKRINKACEFLRDAHEAHIINLDMMSCEAHARKGVSVYKHAHRNGSKQRYIVPEGEGYSSKPFQPNVRVFSSRQFFAQAVRHAIKMAKAIENEPKQIAKKGGTVSLRITRPYDQTNWKPAKLAA